MVIIRLNVLTLLCMVLPSADNWNPIFLLQCSTDLDLLPLDKAMHATGSTMTFCREEKKRNLMSKHIAKRAKMFLICKSCRRKHA